MVGMREASERRGTLRKSHMGAVRQALDPRFLKGNPAHLGHFLLNTLGKEANPAN